MLIHVSEEQSARLITHAAAFEAVQKAFLTAARGEGKVFPTVIAHGSDSRNTYSIKSASTLHLSGLKVGSFWPDNPTRGLARHNSTIFLIDQKTGRIAAVVEASTVNAYRTAAADAVAAQALSRVDSETLAIFGAGNQALFECCALARVRQLKQLHIVTRSSDRAHEFPEKLASQGLELETFVSAAEEACQAADIIVTATPARSPLFREEWVREGTHVASMGSDARGKQELPTSLFGRARLFCDLLEQSIQIGDFQHVREKIIRGELSLYAIGDVLDGRCPGRVSPNDITIFDSSGIALQDLHIADFLVGAVNSASQAHESTGSQ